MLNQNTLDSKLVDLTPPPDASPRTKQAFATFNRLWNNPPKKKWGKGLTNLDAIMIRCFFNSGIPWQRLTDLYKVSFYTIRDIVSGKTWKDSFSQVAPLDELPPSDLVQPKPSYLLVLNKFGNDLMSPDGSTCLLTPCTPEQATEFLKSTGQPWTLQTIQAP